MFYLSFKHAGHQRSECHRDWGGGEDGWDQGGEEGGGEDIEKH